MPDLSLNPASSFRGFGEAKQGRAYFMQGMEQGLYGAAARLSNVSVADNQAGSLPDLGDVYALASGELPGGPALFAQDSNGHLYSRLLGGDTWSLYYKFIESFAGAGLVAGDNDRLYIVGNRYLAEFDTQLAPYSTGTIAVTNGSPNVEGTGTNFTSGFVAPFRIKIAGVWYTVQTITDATHIVLSTNYAGATASGVAFEAFGTGTFIEKFKDFGAARELTDSPAYQWAQPFNYEGDVLIPRKNDMCRLNNDGSFNDPSNPAIDFDNSLMMVSAAGGVNGILMALNHKSGRNAYLVLWDNFSDRSIAPWIRLNDQILSVQPYNSGWIVVTERRIVFTNGYSMRTLSKGIDSRFGEAAFAAIPNGVTVADDRVIICNQSSGYARKRGGIYIYHIDSDAYEFVPILDKYGYNATPNAVFIDADEKVNVSCATVLPSRKYITKLISDAPANASLITQPLGASPNGKHGDSVKLDMAILEGDETISATIAVKIAAMNRRPWGIQKSKIVGVDTSHITVDGTALGNVQAGDEIIILEGANAGLSRHVTEITGEGTATEVWTLDAALSSNIEANCYINLTPFRKTESKTVSSASELREMFFDVKNRYKGKNFLVKVQISGLSTPIEILDVAIVTADKKLQS